MYRLKGAAVAALVAAIGLLLYGAMEGDVRLAFFLIFPILYGSGAVAALGILLLFAALVLWLFGSFAGMGRAVGRSPGFGVEPESPADRQGDVEPRARTRSGGVVLIGPIPIVWGSDRRILPWMVGLGAALLILAIAAWWLLGG